SSTQRIKGLLAIVGEGAAIFRAKLLNRFRLPEQSTCRKYRKHCMASNESLSSNYVNSHSLTRVYWATSSLSNGTRAETYVSRAQAKARLSRRRTRYVSLRPTRQRF